jgi:hypothetical protein
MSLIGSSQVKADIEWQQDPPAWTAGTSSRLAEGVSAARDGASPTETLAASWEF